MKRLAVLILTACLGGFAPLAAAADPIPAPTIPTVPAPVYCGNVLAPANAAGPAIVVPPRGTGERTLPQPRSLVSNFRAEPYDPVAPKPATVAPIAQPAPVVIATTSAGSCDSCRSTDCLTKFKNWLCYRQTPVKLGLTPTPYTAPLAAQFPCAPTAGYSSGGCAPTPAACGPRVGGGLPCRGTSGGCVPVGADPVLPGYRFATPVNTHVGPTPTPVLDTNDQPLPVVPYKSN